MPRVWGMYPASRIPAGSGVCTPHPESWLGGGYVPRIPNPSWVGGMYPASRIPAGSGVCTPHLESWLGGGYLPCLPNPGWVEGMYPASRILAGRGVCTPHPGSRLGTAVAGAVSGARRLLPAVYLGAGSASKQDKHTPSAFKKLFGERRSSFCRTEMVPKQQTALAASGRAPSLTGSG